MNPAIMKCFVFDFGMTLSSQPYFQTCPAECPEWFQLFQENVFSGDPTLFDQWMAGDVDAEGVSNLMAPIVELPAAQVLEYMILGLLSLKTNSAVLEVAKTARKNGTPTILVTGNIDLFDSVIVPDLGLDTLFDVIVNSARSRSLVKKQLWDEAFDQLGTGLSYADSFLIEDSLRNVESFRESGGHAHHYRGDPGLLRYLRTVGFPLNSDAA